MLRDYQTAVVNRVLQHMEEGKRQVLVQMPTGAGKTIVGVELVRMATDMASKVLVVVPSMEIYRQTKGALERGLVSHIDLQAGDWPTLYGAQVVLAMAMTLDRRVKEGQLFVGWQPDLLLFDEAHLLLDHHDRIFAAFGGTSLDGVAGVGLSATPCRLDGRSMLDLWPTIVQGLGVRELQGMGHLVPCVTYEAPMPDLSAIAISHGDYDSEQMGHAFANERVVESVSKAWRKHAAGRPTITFAPTVAVSRLLVAAYRAHGIRATHIDANSNETERTGAVDALKRGQLDVLCNVGVFVHGLDVIEASCVQLVTATASLAKYMQMVGRGLRPATGKTDLVVIDHGGNCYRHDTVDADRDWARDGKPLPRTIKACAGCDAVIQAWFDICQRCHERGGKRASVEIQAAMTTHGVPTRLPPVGCPDPRKWMVLEAKRVRHGLALDWPDRQLRALLAA